MVVPRRESRLESTVGGGQALLARRYCLMSAKRAGQMDDLRTISKTIPA